MDSIKKMMLDYFDAIGSEPEKMFEGMSCKEILDTALMSMISNIEKLTNFSDAMCNAKKGKLKKEVYQEFFEAWAGLFWTYFMTSHELDIDIEKLTENFLMNGTVPESIVEVVNYVRSSSPKAIKPKKEQVVEPDVVEVKQEEVLDDKFSLTALATDVPVGYQVRNQRNIIVGNINVNSNAESGDILLEELDIDGDYDNAKDKILILKLMVEKIRQITMFKYTKLYVISDDEAFPDSSEWMAEFGFKETQQAPDNYSYLGSNFLVFDIQ